MWWVFVVIGVAFLIFLVILACLKIAKESDESLYRSKQNEDLKTLFSIAHIVVELEMCALKQLLQNQGCSEEVLKALDADAVTIHSRIDSDRMLANRNIIEANFYLQYEEEYQNMLKGLVGCLAEMNGNELIEQINADWIQLHNDYISGGTNHEG